MPPLTVEQRFAAASAQLPLVAILRGITSGESVEIGRRLYEAGFRLIEVPLNSPEPFKSIAAIRQSLPDDALVGAGTVLTVDQVRELKDSGGDLTVMPHADTAVIRAVKAVGMAYPGRGDADRSFRRFGGGGGCAEDISCRTGDANDPQGDSRGSAQGHAPCSRSAVSRRITCSRTSKWAPPALVWVPRSTSRA